MTDATSKNSRDAFDAIAWLDPPLLVSRSVAGKSYDVWIAGKETTLTLPRKGPDLLTEEDGKPMGPIPDFPPPPLADPILRGAYIKLTSRAQLSEAPLIIEAVRLRWQDAARTRRVRKGDFAGDGFDEDLGPWLSLVRDWLTAWMGGVRRSVAQEPTPVVRMASAAYNGSIGGGGNSTVVGLYLGGRRVSTPGELRAAFAAASTGRSL
jgi:hypothetical protein